jgi:hypothetical protein
VRFEIKTGKFQRWIIPGGGAVHNIKSTADGQP